MEFILSDTINVYWSPCNETHQEINKSMWYLDPENVYKKHTNNKNDNMDHYATMFTCPAVQNKLTNVWSFASSIETKLVIEDSIVTKHYGIPLRPTPRVNSIANTGHLWFDLSWLFFADAPLVAAFTSPYFDNVKHNQVMAIPPASFDIGQWFRPFNSEYIVWSPEHCEVHIKPNDPMFYIEFLTDKKINLIRFEQSEKIMEYARGCSKSTDIFGRGKGLENRYDKFKSGHMKELVIKEIQKNILEGGV